MLRLDGFACGYGAMRAVNGLDLEVPPGAVFALIGANGAGKTSTVMAIAGHVEIQAGRVWFDGADLTHRPALARVRAGIALVPEGRRLFPDLTVDETLTVGGYALPKPRTAANRASVFELFPLLADRRDQRAGSMSGGEQQMLAIARALMAEPRMLLIDEVSLGLSPKMADFCVGVIQRLRAEGLTILLVEQSTVRALSVADHVCVLESGRSVYRGTGAEARRNPALIDAYLGLRPPSPSPPPERGEGS